MKMFMLMRYNLFMHVLLYGMLVTQFANMLTGLCVLISSFSAINANSVSQDVPYFADTLNNVTVPVGRDATFQCIVANLKKGYQVNKTFAIFSQ